MHKNESAIVRSLWRARLLSTPLSPIFQRANATRHGDAWELVLSEFTTRGRQTASGLFGLHSSSAGDFTQVSTVPQN